MIKYVEELCAQLEYPSFAQTKLSVKREVQLSSGKTAERVAPQRSLSGCWWCRELPQFSFPGG